MYKHFFKRLFDMILSLLLLLLFSPLFLLLAILIKRNIGSPVIFQQKRPGKNEKPFNLYKFSSMSNERDEGGQLLPDDERLNSFGRKLRQSSLDELPELINILKGDMSFVGPRPLLERYLPYYSKDERLRHTVRPGLTGLAQVKGRNLLSWDERLKLDTDYVKSMSIKLDIEITIQTFFKVIKREDIVVGKDHIMEALDGERAKHRDNWQ